MMLGEIATLASPIVPGPSATQPSCELTDIVHVIA